LQTDETEEISVRSIESSAPTLNLLYQFIAANYQ